VTVFVWAVVVLIVVVRGIVAFTLPLTGDEAYYWEWSRHLAWGYVDHPPAVAATIALFSLFGTTPGLVRLGFVLCGLIASLAIAGCATELTGGDRRAGAVAALALALTPLASLAFGSASPDGPYLMFWSLALWFGARAFQRDSLPDWVLLGAALAGVLLSRVLGFALLFGVCAYSLTPGVRHVWRRGLPLALGVALVLYAPFVAWNASHHWVTLLFGLQYRHQETHSFSLRRVATLIASQAAAYSPGIFLAVLLLALRPRNAFLAWTAIPQLVVVTALAFVERVEIHWIFGTLVSLAAMLGVAYTQLSYRLKVVWTTICVVPGAILVPAILAVTFAPIPIYKIVHRETGAQLRNGGPFEIMTYSMVAKDAAKLAHDRNAVVMTDGYGLSSVMDFDAGLAPIVIGYNWQGRESRSWYPDGLQPGRALARASSTGALTRTASAARRRARITSRGAKVSLPTVWPSCAGSANREA
jgi:4-amino-4-deoxy-L-arabinose transferase-like glycosyltransferase